MTFIFKGAVCSEAVSPPCWFNYSASHTLRSGNEHPSAVYPREMLFRGWCYESARCSRTVLPPPTLATCVWLLVGCGQDASVAPWAGKGHVHPTAAERVPLDGTGNNTRS